MLVNGLVHLDMTCVMALTPVDIILCRSSEGDIYVFFIETVEADMMVGRVEQ